MMVVKIFIDFGHSFQVPYWVKLGSLLLISSAEISHDGVTLAHVDMIRCVLECRDHLKWIDFLVMFGFVLCKNGIVPVSYLLSIIRFQREFFSIRKGLAPIGMVG
jgi:hypothetical protein